MLLVCPRCSGSLPPEARACPRCGLVLASAAQLPREEATDAFSGNGRDTAYGYSPAPSPAAQPTLEQEAVPLVETPAASPRDLNQNYGQDYGQDYGQPESEVVGTGTAPYVPAEQPQYSLPVRPSARPVSEPLPAPADTRGGTASLLVPRGAVEMLPNESVVFQLGALYLTNKRVILLAPSVLRAAFLRDVDAVGTLTERASGLSFFFGLVMLGLAAAAAYFSLARNQWREQLPIIYNFEPMIYAVLLGAFAVYLLANYFFWVKRTLFLSVGGRPLITVSVTDWNARKLEGMDAFINAFSQVKDASIASETVE